MFDHVHWGSDSAGRSPVDGGTGAAVTDDRWSGSARSQMTRVKDRWPVSLLSQILHKS